jgi:hypothetical protein
MWYAIAWPRVERVKSDFSHATDGQGWGVCVMFAVFNNCVLFLQIGEDLNPELRIFASVFNQVKFKGELEMNSVG